VIDFEAQMCSAGISGEEAASRGAVFAELSRELCELRGESAGESWAFFAPGRVELVGKHTDYGGGRSLICAIERGICVLAAARNDARVRMVEMGRGAIADFELDAEARDAYGDAANHAETVARRVAHDFPNARTGADIVFASDLPPASGMSSSSALVVGVFYALASANRLQETDSWRFIETREQQAGYLGAVESGEAFAAFASGRGVGTLGGSEDHVAILCSQAGFLRQYSYCPIRLEKEIRMPEEYSLVIGVSGVKAEKAGNARELYNRISIVTRRILELWRSATRKSDVSLAAALESSSDAAARLREILRNSADLAFPPETLLNRLNQFMEESNAIVPEVSEALASEDLEQVGSLVDRSQCLAETMLENQTPETIELQRSARRLGAAAASAFGAGFGGSVWALVRSERASDFRNEWAAGYRQRFPELSTTSEFLITNAGPGLIRL
jgi:galactokinase